MEKGGKANSLERLKAAGFNVPDFFVCDKNWSDSDISAKIDRQLHGTRYFAIRSSAQGEDSAKKSFAGQFYSAVGIPRDRVLSEIKNVLASFEDRAGSVIVQKFVPSDTAGVMFTEVGGDKVVINATAGLCRPVVSGEPCDEYICDKKGTVFSKSLQAKSAERFRDGATLRELVDRWSLTDTEVRRLVSLAEDVHKYFGSPQDIEWCFEKGQLYVLQSRPITRDFNVAHTEFFDSANIAESYSGIVLPLTCSFAKMVYERVYKDLLRMSGVPRNKIEKHSRVFENLLGFFYGRMYYNMNNWYRMAEFVPGYRRNKENFESMITSNIREEVAKTIKPSAVLRVCYPLIVSFKMAMYGIVAANFKSRVIKHLNRLRESDFEHISYEECTALFRVINDKLLRKWYVTLENDFFVMTYLGLLKKLFSDKDLQRVIVFPSKATEQVSALVSLSREMGTRVALWQAVESGNTELFNLELTHEPEIQVSLNEYLRSFGGRFASELKLESIGVDEDTGKLLSVIRAYHDYEPKVSVKAEAFRLPIFRWLTAKAVLWKFRKYASRREEFRLMRSNMFAMARKLFRRMGKILCDEGIISLQDDIFYLELDEILQPIKRGSTLKEMVESRKKEYSAFRDLNPPAHFSTVNNQHPSIKDENTRKSSIIQAHPSSPGRVRGRVRIFKEFTMPTKIDFDILVTSHTDPGWTPLIALSKGLIIEHGGVLSHASIVARELGIPTVIGAVDAMAVLRDGQMVEIDGSSGMITSL